MTLNHTMLLWASQGSAFFAYSPGLKGYTLQASKDSLFYPTKYNSLTQQVIHYVFFFFNKLHSKAINFPIHWSLIVGIVIKKKILVFCVYHSTYPY